MRLLLPMACTIAFVMKSATYTDGKPSNPNDNYTYRLLEVELDPPETEEPKTRQPSKARPSNDDYVDNSYQQSTIPKQTQPSYSGTNEDYHDNENADDSDQSDTTKAPTKPKGKRTPRNGKIVVNAEIPPDFQREISQLRIPRRVTKKKKSKPHLKKTKKTADEDTDTDTDMDMNMDMDVTVDMDLGLGEEFNARYDNDNKNMENNNDDQDQNHDDSNDHNKTYKKDGKRYKKRRGKGKSKGKGKRKRRPKSTSNEHDDGNKDLKSQNDDDDEANHQEEEEEVEEKKEKTHKLIIKKRRPYVNGTKPTSVSASASGAKQSTPISHTHVHSYSGPSYQSLIGKKPGWGNANKPAIGDPGGAKRLQKHHHQQQHLHQQPQHHQQQNLHQQKLQVPKPVKPLTLQETPAVEVLNANHQEISGGLPKGIKPRDVNLILRTKNSPRILIRRYKPLFGAYPVSLNLVGGRRKLVYRRPFKGRKKACKRCKKKQPNRHNIFNQYPGLASDDVEMLHSTDLGNYNQAAAAAAPTACAHTADQLSPLSPLQVSAFSGPKYPWYEDGNSAGVGMGTPSSYFPHNKFEYADENVISPRFPSQPVNAYIQMPLPVSPQTPSLSPAPPVFGSGRSSNGNEDDNPNVNNIYETSPSDANTNSAIVSPTRQQQEDQEIKSDEPKARRRQRERQKPQEEQPQQQDSGEESLPAYQVHEMEYEPVTGHENVEDLAAVHQLETDASLFADERQPVQLQLQPSTDAENDGDSNDAIATFEEADEADEEQEERPHRHRHRQSNQDDEDLGDAAGDQEGQVEEDEEEGEDQDERKQEPKQQQQYVDDENENQPSDDTFDFSNADAWTEEMVETDS